jgi:hypothetical protein
MRLAMTLRGEMTGRARAIAARPACDPFDADAFCALASSGIMA